jgi:hypothetical protein
VESAGARSLRAVFVGGSLAGDDIAWAPVGGVIEIYSDIDLYVVMSADADEEAVRAAAAASAGAVASDPGVLMTRAPDVGVYGVEDLLDQPARPGTVALAERHIHLWGDRRIYSELRARIGAAIDPAEALYLIENRLAQLASLAADEDGGARRLASTLRLKTYIDVAAAYAIASGRYDGSRGAVPRAVAALAQAGGGLEAHASRCEQAARYLRALGDYLLGDGDRELEARAETTALEAWKRIAGERYGLPEEEWMEMIERRCHRGQHAGNFKQFVAMRRRMGRTRPRSMWEGMHLTTFAPVDALRVATLAAAAGGGRAVGGVVAAEGAYGAFVERLTRTCGFVDGALGARARAMHRAVAR